MLAPRVATRVARCSSAAPQRAMSSLRPTYAITSEQEELREAARVFATTELVELAAELERDNKPVPDEWRKRYEGDACNSANLAGGDLTPFSCLVN